MKTNDCQLLPEPDNPLCDDLAAAVALTAPRHRAPVHCLTLIKSRVARASSTSVNSPGTAMPRRARLAWVGFGLAAALAVFGGWQTVRVVRLNKEIISLKSTSSQSPDGSNNIASDRGPASHTDGDSGDPFSPSHKRTGPQSRGLAAESIIVTDRAELQRKLDELQRLSDAHFQPVPGLARTVVMELQVPGSKPTTPIRTPTLSHEVAELIASGMDKNRPAGKPPLTVSGSDKSRPGDELIIQSGLPNLSAFTLQPDATLLHQDFPADTWQQWEGLHLLNDGRFYDELNNIIWKPLSGEGRRYSGRMADEPIDLSSQAAPRDAVAPVPANAPASEARIWSIYDESRGEGRLVVSDLPPVPDGKAYQLWFEDARSSTPITAGLLPPLESGSGQVWFELTPGISPVNYRLTLEPAAGSTSPQGPTVLTGP